MSISESSEQNDILPDIINMISNRNILLLYQDTVPIHKLVLGFVLEDLKKNMKSLIWVCWDEPARSVKKRIENFGYELDNISFIDLVGNTIEDECTILRNPKNYSGILMDIQKSIKNTEFVLVLDSPDITGDIDGKNIFIRFLSTLLRMCNTGGGTLYSPVRIDLLDFEMKKLFQSLFEVVLYISEDMIKVKSDSFKVDIYYKIENNNLEVRPFPAVDIEKIEEIFNLSDEDKRDLDEIVRKHLDQNMI